MQPSSSTKPVMDVAAPKSSAPAHNPFAQSNSAPKPTSNEPAALPVRPAPLANAPQPTTPLSHLPPSRRPVKKPASAQSTAHTPVALITVTIFVMLVLSILAVTVYITSQTA